MLFLQLGAFMIDSRLGRKRSLALATFLTAVFCVGFCQVTTQLGVSLMSILISLAATVSFLSLVRFKKADKNFQTMWAILYG